jgi:hypothetical protein
VARADVQLTQSEFQAGKASSTYVVLCEDRGDLRQLGENPGWRLPRVAPGTPLWTDDFSNLGGALLRP